MAIRGDFQQPLIPNFVNKANSQFCVLRNIVFCAKKHSFVRENKHRLITITITVLFSEGRKRCKEILYIIYINIYIIYNFNSYFFSARVMERNLKLLLLLLSIAVSRHSSAESAKMITITITVLFSAK